MGIAVATVRPAAARTKPRANAGTYVGLFMVTLSTLMLEVTLTRIFSVTMWYHFAFVAISVALFGMTVGALGVHLFPHRFEDERVDEQLWFFSLLFGVAVAVCFVVQLLIPFTPRFTLGGIASVVATCAVISVPFVLGGVVVCLALTKFPGRVNRLYATDLVGAGLGCVLVVVLFSWFDGPSLVILIAALASAGALAFAFTAAGPGRRRRIRLAATAVVVLAGFAGANAYLHADGRPVLRIIWAKEARDADHDYERWNAFSRLTVDGDPADPNVDRLSLVIDSTAGTVLLRYSGDPNDSDLLRDEIQNLPHHIRGDADVLVVGAGGGADVLSALEFDQRSVTAVEINGDIIDITHNKFGDFTGHLDRDPRVDIVNDEARAYLARTERSYDVIQISLIDTWAATAAGAFALSENSLYTTEAWDLFLDRLQPGGILAVTRYFATTTAAGDAVEPLETYRTVALASEVLTQRGVARPRDHVTIYRMPTGYGVDLATVMVSREPFSAGDRATLAARAAEFGFSPLITADAAADPVMADLLAPGGPSDAISSVPGDISPPSDNQPFFFQMADLGTFTSGDIFRDDHLTRPVMILGLLALTVLGLASCCIAVPLLVERRSPRQGADRRRALPFYTYFSGIGLGFMFIEIAQLQRLSIFLGHPTFGLTVVLFSVLVFGGIGSMVSERVLRRGGPWSARLLFVVLIGVVAIVGAITPNVLHAMDDATNTGRIAVAVSLLAPLALVMGMPFAIGMRAASAAPGVPTAFLWGINGAASVCGSVFGVVIALFFGISASFWTGGLAYLLAAGSMVAISARQSAAPEADRDEPEPVAALVTT